MSASRSDFSTSSTISRKSGWRTTISASSCSPAAPRTWRKERMALPKPYQPVIRWRFCDQAKTQGIARRSAIDLAPKRRAGREPILSIASSSTGLACWK